MIATVRKAKSKTSDVQAVTRSVILSREIDAKILAIAERDERPLTWVIAKAVKEYIDRDEKRAK